MKDLFLLTFRYILNINNLCSSTENSAEWQRQRLGYKLRWMRALSKLINVTG